MLANIASGLSIERFHNLSGAILGASFYILLRAGKYVSDRTFDPKYNSVYIIRFATGIVAGFILTIILADHKISFPPVLLALLGGFSAEAVEQILQRMVEVMLAVVHGDGSAARKADEQAKKSSK